MISRPIIECVKEYFDNCPYLELLSGLNIKDNKYWSIDQVETPMILGTNVLGDVTHRQFCFMIVSGVFNPSTELENLENLHLFENITEWVYQNIKNGIKPSLNDNEEVISMNVEAGGYTFNDDKTECSYQITVKMLYDKREE